MGEIETNSLTVMESADMGRVTVDVKLANNRDVQMSEAGAISAELIRRTTLQATVDPGATWLVLPTAVADQLGLPRRGKAIVTYGDRRSGEREIADQVEAELLGRKGTFQALLEPARTTALIGAVVLEVLDLLVDCKYQRLLPRDPAGLTTEVE
jgi:predicted aspartyl protease